MNQLQKDIIKMFNNWYKTCKTIAKVQKVNVISIDSIEQTSEYITKEIESIDANGSKPFKDAFLKMVNTLIHTCKEQSDMYGGDFIPLKTFKGNINTIKSNFKEVCKL